MSLSLMRSRLQDVCVSLISEGLDSETWFKRKPGMCFGPAKLLQWASEHTSAGGLILQSAASDAV